jgi:predicted metal-dependent hydrolase
MTGETAAPSFTVTRSRRRTVALHIDNSGQLEVRAPHWLSRRDITAFVVEKQAWIQAQKQRLAALPRFEEPDYRDGGLIRLFGEKRRLVITQENRRHPAMLTAPSAITSAGQCSGEPACLTLVVRGVQGPESVKTAFRRLLREHLARHIAERIAHWQEHELLAPLPTLDVRLRLMKRRWGSCRRNGLLTFSEALGKYPVACIEVVIVHELCHLRHFNHGPDFHALMTSLLPGWKAADALLLQEARRY